MKKLTNQSSGQKSSARDTDFLIDIQSETGAHSTVFGMKRTSNLSSNASLGKSDKSDNKEPANQKIETAIFRGETFTLAEPRKRD